jgi:class 3 adenylate cyclase
MASRTGTPSRLIVLLSATASAALFLHWIFTQPAIGDLRALRTALFTLVFAAGSPPDALTPIYQKLTIAVAAATGLLAGALAVMIELRTQPTPATRRLALSLSLGALAGSWFFVAVLHPVYRDASGYGPIPAWNMVLNTTGYLAAAMAAFFLMRFFFDYPRSAPLEEWERYYRALREAENASVSTGWRARVIPAVLRRPTVHDGGRFAVHRFMSRWTGAALLAAPALVSALGDSMRAANADSQGWVLVQAVGFGTLYVGFLGAFLWAFEAMRYHVRNSVADDRRRIDWIYATVFVGGLVPIVAAPLWWLALPMVLPWIERSGVMVTGATLMLAPFSLSLQLAVLAFVVSLALSIFYRGTVDPRLALGKVTVFGAIGIVLAFLFILLERAVAYQVAEWLGLAPESGALIAGALVAASVAPVRSRTDRWVGRFLARYLPLESIMQGERRTQAIVLSDLTGYTALSARDEKQAMLVAALLQRQAALQCEAHGGRIVKTMGDAVLLAFEDAASAAKALAGLHREYPPAALALGLEQLPVHSGAHFGEVTITGDGDVFGQTVNIAARLQGLAAPGQAVVSDAFSRAAAIAGTRRLGPRSLKNVPDPVECEEMALA